MFCAASVAEIVSASKRKIFFINQGFRSYGFNPIKIVIPAHYYGNTSPLFNEALVIYMNSIPASTKRSKQVLNYFSIFEILSQVRG